MRQIHFNKYERVAGMFILVAIGGSIATAVSVAVKQGWFEPRVQFEAVFQNAESVHAGTTVKMAGLSAGAVDDVELLPDSRVRVNFHLLGHFRDRVHADSKAMLLRPFIIGDRVVEVTVGRDSGAPLEEHAQIASEESSDLMTLLSGREMGLAINRAAALGENLQQVLTALSDKDRITSVVRIFDRLEPMLNSVDTLTHEVTKLARQANHGDNLGKVLEQVATLTGELNRIVPAINRENPDLGKDLAILTKSLTRVTTEMDRAVAELGPNMPATAKRAVEALNEATILMKAMQKSFLMRGSVREVHEEEAAAATAKEREPASK